MATLLFKLNGVPEDEADDVRQLLTDNEIEYYETSAGRWQISVAAIWLKDESAYTTARELINTYQQQRRETQRQLARIHHETWWMRMQQRPADTVMALLALIAVLLLSMLPFIDW